MAAESGASAEPGTSDASHAAKPPSRTAEWYRHFGLFEAPGSSACYSEWTLGIADDPALIERIEQWPHHKRQPNLMLAAARFLGAQISPYAAFREFLDAHWTDVTRIVLSRATQTNEAGRCATLLPSFAAIAAADGKPLALIEVGASAGLVLFPDQYSYEFDDGTSVTRLAPARVSGSEAPVLRCTTTGPVPLPDRLPEVTWRAGIDLNPLDVNNPEDVAWLEALVWPEQDFRRERLRQAVAVARRDPPRLVAGDLNRQLLDLAGHAPDEATLVIFHSAVLGYLNAGERARFRETIASLAAGRGCHWLSNEGHKVIDQEDGSNVVPEMAEDRLRGRFLLLHNGKPVAITGPHGQSIEWLEP
ncbi:DUF2332 domain-containing protein [Pseudarthrobacter sp. N5]|uniref:DUF2332 domain-containing protein n=1 Tax=Pseudarthrobacter sp. N5 TaxID=3418416 RepID=UPI003CFB244E